MTDDRDDRGTQIPEGFEVVEAPNFSPVQAPQPSPLSQTPRIQTALRSNETAQTKEELLSSLEPHQRTALEMRHSTDPEFRESLPGNTRIMTIKYNAADREKVREFLQRAALIAPPLQTTTFLGNGQDEFVYENAILRHPSSAITLARKAQEEGLTLELSRIETRKVPTLKIGSNILALHPSVVQKQSKPKKEGVSLSKITEKDTQEDPEVPNEAPTLREIKQATEKKESIVPKERPCNYLVINLNSISNPQTIKKLKGSLASLSSKSIHVIQHNGHIVIINTPERAGSKIRSLAKLVAKDTGNKAVQFYGTGEIKRKDDAIYIEGFPTFGALDKMAQTSLRQAVDSMNIYLLDSHAQNANTGRDASHFTVKHKSSGIEGLSVLTTIEDKIGLNSEGGPDQIIGREKERERLEKSTDPTEKKPRLIIVEGEAGAGKSCLLEEIRQKRESITIALDPSEENNPYGQLCLIGKKIGEIMSRVLHSIAEENGEENDYIKWLKKQIEPIVQYAEKGTPPSSEDEAYELVENIISGLNAYENRAYPESKPFLLIIDDIHHMDEQSDHHVMTLIGRFLATSNSKCLISTRPEEIKSTQRNYLEKQAGKNFGMETIELPNINFREDYKNAEDKHLSLAYRYIFHSIPENLRLKAGSKEPKELGHGVEALANLSDSPLELVDYIIDLKRNFKRNFIVTADSIDIKQEAIDEIIQKGGGTELVTYNKRRVLDVLNDEERTFMACISMLGSTTSIEQLTKIAEDILGCDGDTLIRQLTQKKYLRPTELDGEGRISHLKIRHDTTRKAVLDTFQGPAKIKMAITLFNKFSDRRDISDDVKFSLLQYAAPIAPPSNTRFWRLYSRYAMSNMENAEDRGQNEKAYQLSKTVLGDPEGEDTAIGTLLTILGSTVPIPKNEYALVPLTLKSLKVATASSLQTGKFQEVYRTIEILEKIHSCKETLDTEMGKMYRIGIEAAYADRNPSRLNEFTIKANLDRTEQFVADLRTKYREAEQSQSQKEKLEELIRFYEEGLEAFERGASETDKIKATRMIERIRTQFAIIERKSRLNLDDDIELQAYGFTNPQLQQFEETKQKLDKLKEAASKRVKQIQPIDRLHLSEQEGELSAMLGEEEKAIDFFTEGLRIARKMGNHSMALRLAKRIGDLQVIKGISTKHDHPFLERSSAPDKNWLMKATDTYSQGLLLLKLKDEKTGEPLVEESNFNNLAIRIQFIRSVALTCEEYAREIQTLTSKEEDLSQLRQIQSDMKDTVETALSEYRFLKDSDTWNQLSQDQEVSYYLNSSIGPILEFIGIFGTKAHEFGVEPKLKIPEDIYENPFFSPETIIEGLRFAGVEDLTDDSYDIETDEAKGAESPLDNLREKNTKIRGLKTAFSHKRPRAD